MGIVGGLWFFDHPVLATAALIDFCYLGLVNRLNELEERRREDQRALEEAAQRRHNELTHALDVLYKQRQGPRDND